MSLTLREENFVVIDVGTYTTKAGIGANDTNKPPSVTLANADYNTPIKDNDEINWEDLESLWGQVLFKELSIKKSRNECPVLLAVPQSWTKHQLEKVVQMFFENFNAPGVYIASQPLMALYGCGAVTGLIIDIGHNTTKVNIAIDSIMQNQSSFTSPVGGKYLTQHLLRYMKQDNTLIEEFRAHNESGDDELKLDEEFAQFVKEYSGLCNVLVDHEIEENLLSVEMPASLVSTPSAAKEDTPAAVDAVEEQDALKKIPDRQEIEYKGKKFTIGRYRHRVYDPLFNPALVGLECLSLCEMIRAAVQFCEAIELRPKIMENMVLTGGGSLMAGTQRRIKSEMINHLPVSDNAGDLQPRLVKFLRIPDYFTVLKESKYQQYATWLGSLIVAKLVFIDSKNYISKVDYNDVGDYEIFDLVDELEKIEGKEVDFYTWLNIEPSATDKQINRAYKKMSLQLHPDKNKNDPKQRDRFARLGKVVSILRDGHKRERYNFFYKNGVPRWRGTGYLYSRWRPGLGTVIVALGLLGGGLQYLVAVLNYSQEKKKIRQFVIDARSEMASRATKNIGAATLGRSYIEVGNRILRCEVKSDDYIVFYPEGEGRVDLNVEWLEQPSYKNIYFISWPKKMINRLLGKEEEVTEYEFVEEDESSDQQSGASDKGSPAKPASKKRAKKTEPLAVTGTKVGGRRRAIKKQQ